VTGVYLAQVVVNDKSMYVITQRKVRVKLLLKVVAKSTSQFVISLSNSSDGVPVIRMMTRS